ncbi:unnamed protein product [Urochloa humidicola]
MQWRWELVAARLLPWYDPSVGPNAVFLHQRLSEHRRRDHLREPKAEASVVLRGEVRNLFLSEIQVFGRIEFDVEGEVAGLGYLRCKFFIFEDKAAGADVPKSPCLVQR